MKSDSPPSEGVLDGSECQEQKVLTQLRHGMSREVAAEPERLSRRGFLRSACIVATAVAGVTAGSGEANGFSIRIPCIVKGGLCVWKPVACENKPVNINICLLKQGVCFRKPPPPVPCDVKPDPDPPLPPLLPPSPCHVKPPPFPWPPPVPE